VYWQLLKEEVEKEQELVNSLQNMVVVVDENNENSSDEGDFSVFRCIVEFVCEAVTAM